MSSQAIQIKICGVKDIPTLEVCSECQVKYVGLNLYSGSPRFVPRDHAISLSHIATSLSLQVVLLFYQTEWREIQETISRIPHQRVQLLSRDVVLQNHWKEIRPFLGSKLIPQISVSNSLTDSDLSDWEDSEFLILDSYHPQLAGGSGHSFPWEYVGSIKRPFSWREGLLPKRLALLLRNCILLELM